MKKKSENEVRIELYNDLLRQLVEKRLELDVAHLWEPLKKQDKLCLELQTIEENISLLEKRIEAPSLIKKGKKTK